ncbi:MAG: hypothetical protein AUG49_15515 [Catenulispora sp. 13_1_20CM_3_70_7]|nr:MAG: hypothetical protein AUG49_15515 [Catenulispora sp. 13_1_20CM_3_70_7]
MRFGKRTAMLACAVGFGAAGVGVAGTAEAAPTAPEATAPAIAWQACPQYSDDVLAALRLRPEEYAAFRAIWARAECGTISVPLDYRNPGGEHITIALTRLKAQDAAHRRGVMFTNPGGPGGSGYLMPARLMLENSTNARLNEDFDLIGIDPRGIGYSTSYDCPTGDGPDPGGAPPAPGPLTEAEAKQLYDQVSASNAACSTSNPAFLRQLTTSNAARDLDMIRRGLHERKASYFGASWGTQLGAVYRSMFPETIDRMWLDSVVSPDAYNLSYRFAGSARATEADFHLFAAWLAARNGVYGFGDTTAKAEAAVLAMRQQADAHPWRFSDVDTVLDGAFIGFLAASPNLNWEQAATVLQSLTTAVSGQPAPDPVKQVVGGDRMPLPPPAGAPKPFNGTANVAYLCNEDTSGRDFDSLWNDYQHTLAANPVTGEFSGPRPTCAGWNLPPQPFTLRWSPGSLQMSGHLYETSTPYPWVRQMQARIGGTVLTVPDFIHASVGHVPECAAHMVAYFETGRPDNGTCPGLQPETTPTSGTAAAPPASQSSRTQTLTQPLVWDPNSRYALK